jgi:predicted ribosome quality control (RQC) complex YloA/Tae2 family protein
MTLRARELATVAAEVARVAIGGAVQKVVQPDRYTIVLGLYGGAPPRASWLVASADPAYGRLHLLDGKPPGTGDAAPAFCMQLRKELVGRRLATVEVVPGERACVLRFGDRALRLFLFGRAAQLVLVDAGDGAGDGAGATLGAIGPARRPHEALPPPRAIAPDEPSRLDGVEGSPSAVVARIYDELRARDEATRAEADARARLEALAKKLERKVDALERDRARAASAEERRKHADLILAHLSEIPRGASEVTLPDDFEGGAPIAVALDPALSARDNATRLYKEHKRLSRALASIDARLDETRRALADARAALAGDLSSSHALLDLRESEEPAASSSRARTTTRRAAESPRRPYHEFRSSTGVPILVGRGDDKNDELTFKVARGADLWLHARDVPGAHVIVPLDGGRPVDEQTLLDAATLAAHHSSAKGEAQVDVGYTLRKHVRKPPRARPGSVLTSGLKTIRIRLEPDRLARLLATRVVP